ncbi:hypothetical protein [Chitinophaga sp. GbtcB8]|uniref:hypothetical protein n=1 Tax=Chitinophaga sp. GbtcB8 TaxID=2824753 RepID=UPI001C2FD957|nr:hypothetical protein [Chitinophaga sp. GbtcB8]
MKQTIDPGPGNMLKDIYSRLIAFPIFFRDHVGQECLWSTPTFYRKMRDVTILSNAEKEKIIAVFDEAFEELWDYCEKYRNHNR